MEGSGPRGPGFGNISLQNGTERVLDAFCSCSHCEGSPMDVDLKSTWAGVWVVTPWLDPKLNSSGRTKQVDEDSLVTMVMGLGSISFLLLDDDSLPVWDWQRSDITSEVRSINLCMKKCSKLLRHSQLVHRPQCLPLLAWRMRENQSLENRRMDFFTLSGFLSGQWFSFFNKYNLRNKVLQL